MKSEHNGGSPGAGDTRSGGGEGGRPGAAAPCLTLLSAQQGQPGGERGKGFLSGAGDFGGEVSPQQMTFAAQSSGRLSRGHCLF